MSAHDNLKFIKSVIKLQRVLEQCEESKEAKRVDENEDVNEAARCSGYFGGQQKEQNQDPSGTISNDLGTLRSFPNKDECLSPSEFFKKVPDFSLHFDELCDYFRQDMEKNEQDLRRLKQHKQFEIKTHKVMNIKETDVDVQQVPTTSYMKVDKLIQRKFVEDQFKDWVKIGGGNYSTTK